MRSTLLNHFALTVGIVVLLCATPATSIAQIKRIPDNSVVQMTNAIPTNIFLTDENGLFWYRHHERLVEVNRIKDAANLPESRPAEQDPEGHWGEATNGLQISLRFEKQIFTNGEPVNAVMFVRNVTNQPVAYLQLTQILATKNGKPLNQKNANDGEIFISTPMSAIIFPQTQKKNQKRLDQLFDLTENGEYIFQAVCSHPKVGSDKVSIVIKN
jgi:hypothetical protein